MDVAANLYEDVVKGGSRVRADGLAEWERTYSMFMHLTVVLYHVIPIPIVAPLVMWLIKKEQSAFVDDQGREAVNFQISLVVYAILAGILFMCGIGVLLMLGVYALGIVGCILGSIAAHKGQYFRYPMTIRFIG